MAYVARRPDRVLNPLEQEVVVMTLDDHDGPEIASVLSIMPGNARTLRHRAFGKLRDAVKAIRERSL